MIELSGEEVEDGWECGVLFCAVRDLIGMAISLR